MQCHHGVVNTAETQDRPQGKEAWDRSYGLCQHFQDTNGKKNLPNQGMQRYGGCPWDKKLMPRDLWTWSWTAAVLGRAPDTMQKDWIVFSRQLAGMRRKPTPMIQAGFSGVDPHVQIWKRDLSARSLQQFSCLAPLSSHHLQPAGLGEGSETSNPPCLTLILHTTSSQARPSSSCDSSKGRLHSCLFWHMVEICHPSWIKLSQLAGILGKTQVNPEVTLRKVELIVKKDTPDW